MTRKNIEIGDFQVYAHRIWARQWLVLTAGDFAAGEYNAMTVGWGSFGTMWGKPFAQVVVRPERHTRKFMEEFPTFTLSAFSDDYRQALQMIGGMSGRDSDKIAAANLHPMAATTVAAPAFEEAEMVVECRKMYWQDMEPDNFLDASIEKAYPAKDYHRIYFGEIVAVTSAKA